MDSTFDVARYRTDVPLLAGACLAAAGGLVALAGRPSLGGILSLLGAACGVAAGFGLWLRRRQPPLHAYARLFRLSPHPVGLSTLHEGRFLAVNEAFVEQLGYPRREIIGRTARGIGLWVDDSAREAVAREVEGDAAIRGLEAQIRTREGEVRSVLLFGERVHVSGEDCLLALALDITRFRETEEALQASQERLSTVFRISPVPMAITSLPEGRLLEVNEAALDLYGWRRQEAVGRTTEELGLWVSRRERERAVRAAEEAGFIEGMELRLRTRSGSVRHVLLSAVRTTLDDQPCLLSISHDITARKAGEEELRRQALHDGLTGLSNRSAFVGRLERVLSGHRKSDREGGVAVLFADLDHFKQVNDTLGHAGGDALLRAVAERLARCFREEDTVARLGGDEFGVLLGDVTDEAEVLRATRRMVDAVAQPFAIQGARVETGISVGVALAPHGQSVPDDLLRAADEAMYRVKNRGGGGYEIGGPDTPRPESPAPAGPPPPPGGAPTPRDAGAGAPGGR